MTQSKSKMNLLSPFLKLAISVGLIYWTYYKGLWNFSYLENYLHQPMMLIGGFLLLCLTLVLIAWRWKNVLTNFDPNTKHTKLLTYINIIWISCLFNSFLPGSVAGDLLRYKYKSRLGNNIKTSTTLLTTFFDRVIALMIMLLLASLAPWVLDLQEFTHSKFMASSLELIKLLSFIPFAFYIALILPKPFIQKMLRLVPLIKDSHRELILSFHALKNVVFINSLVTIFTQSILMGLFLWWGNDIWQNTSQAVLLISMTALGFVFVAIPISPAGAGVGHVVFETLYREVGLSHGANLFNLYFLINFSINLLGIIPFLLLKADAKAPALKTSV